MATGAAPAMSFKWYDRRWIPVLLLILFFPVGILAVWANHRFSRWTKVILTALVPFLLVVGLSHRAAVRRNVTEADALWDAKRQEEAVPRYKKLVSENLVSLEPADRRRSFERIINFELARGANAEAAHFIDAAVASGTPLALESPEGAAMFAAAQARGKQAQVPSSGEDRMPGDIIALARQHYAGARVKEVAGSLNGKPTGHVGAIYVFIDELGLGRFHGDEQNFAVCIFPPEKCAVLQDASEERLLHNPIFVALSRDDRMTSKTDPATETAYKGEPVIDQTVFVTFFWNEALAGLPKAGADGAPRAAGQPPEASGNPDKNPAYAKAYRQGYRVGQARRQEAIGKPDLLKVLIDISKSEGTALAEKQGYSAQSNLDGYWGFYGGYTDGVAGLQSRF